MRTLVRLAVAATAAVVGRSAFGEDAPRAAPPIREVSVFKDGHAFVLREGEMPVDAAGAVVVTELPRPALGTFWPYARDERCKLTGVTAGKRRVAVERPAVVLADLLRANVGAEGTFQEVGGARWTGKILAFPAGNAGPPAPAMLVDTGEGTRAVALDRIEGVVFKDVARTTTSAEEARDVLTLRLAWAGERAPTARVGFVCLESGLRWIPEYRIDIDGAGAAHVRLQATLVNDLADLDHAAVRLVVGVPKFDFGDLADPVSLQADLVDTASRMRRDSRLLYAAENSIQTQSANDFVDPAAAAARGAVDERVTGASGTEDLFVFDVRDVTLAKGERMTLPVTEFDATYVDVFAVDVPAAAPMEVRPRNSDPRELEAARRHARPKAMHSLRLTNTSSFPLTTAPAIVLRDGRLLGQGQTLYAPAGGRCDVAVTQAVGLRVRKEDHETGRKPDALKWNGDSYARCDLVGSIEIANDADVARDVEISRAVLGVLDTADRDGAVVALNAIDEPEADASASWGVWGRGYDWPWWWARLNGVGRARWTVRVEPHESVKATYAWHYFWR
jgi:hypothetical protein